MYLFPSRDQCTFALVLQFSMSNVYSGIFIESYTCNFLRHSSCYAHGSPNPVFRCRLGRQLTCDVWGCKETYSFPWRGVCTFALALQFSMSTAFVYRRCRAGTCCTSGACPRCGDAARAVLGRDVQMYPSLDDTLNRQRHASIIARCGAFH